jgi:hypothetical protein
VSLRVLLPIIWSRYFPALLGSRRYILPSQPSGREAVKCSPQLRKIFFKTRFNVMESG